MKQSRRIKRRSRNRNSRKLRKLHKTIRGGELLFSRAQFNNAIKAVIDTGYYTDLDNMLPEFSTNGQLRGYITSAINNLKNEEKLMIDVDTNKKLGISKFNGSRLFLTLLKRDAELNPYNKDTENNDIKNKSTNYNPLRGVNGDTKSWFTGNDSVLTVGGIEELLQKLNNKKEEM